MYEMYVVEMFAKVPPVGRCTKKLTSSRWILLGYYYITNIITSLEGG